MATWKALLGTAGGGDFVSSQAFYYYNSRLNRVPNPSFGLLSGDADGNFYNLLYRTGGSEPEYNNQNRNEYAIDLFDKDANYVSTSYVWRSDLSSSNSFYDSNGMNLFPNADGTGIVTNGFMEASYINSYYPMYVGNWSRSNFTSGPDSQFAISRTNVYYQLAAKNNLRIDSNGNNIILHRANVSGMKTAISKFNSDYTSLLWSKYFDDNYSDGRHFDIDDNDNIYYAVENDNYQKVAITKTNSSGTVQWIKQYGQKQGTQIQGVAYNAARDEIVVLYSAEYLIGNSNSSLALLSLDASNGNHSWSNALRPAQQQRNVRGYNLTADAEGNLYMSLSALGLSSPGGYRSSWGTAGIFSVEGDGTARYANAFDPDGKDSTGGQDFQGYNANSCLYDKYTDTVLLCGEGNPYGTSRGSYAARVPADGSLTNSNVEYSMGNSGYSVCYYNIPINNTSGNLHYESYTPTLYSWSNTSTNSYSDYTKTTLSLSSGNINDSTNMKIAGPIT